MTDLQAQIRQFCAAHDLKLNTDLGQHFLVNQDILDTIVNTANIDKTDHIVEIGPGVGVLTKELLKRSNRVTAIEIDERMIPLIEKYCVQLSIVNCQLSIVQDNALQVPFPQTPYKVVANIPYHITSPLLRHAYLESKVQPESMTLLIQKEVADRICLPVRQAGDTKDASLLTIIVGLFGKATKVINVPPSSFLPPPKVDSAVIHIESYDQPIAEPHIIEEVMKLAKIGFSQKRKMLKNSFEGACLPAGRFHGGLELLAAAGIDEKRRPQTLSIEEWIAVAKAVQ